MKTIFVIAFIFAQEILAHHNKQDVVTTCVPRVCGDVYQPVCGKERASGCWKVRIFDNECLMDQANDCNLGKYIPCVPKMCEAAIVWGNVNKIVNPVPALKSVII